MSLGGELDTNLGNNTMGWLAGIDMAYKPFDGIEMKLGYVMARGEYGTSLEVFEPLDQVYLKITAVF